jgi:hypothetical protein
MGSVIFTSRRAASDAAGLLLFGAMLVGAGVTATAPGAPVDVSIRTHEAASPLSGVPTGHVRRATNGDARRTARAAPSPRRPSRHRPAGEAHDGELRIHGERRWHG